MALTEEELAQILGRIGEVVDEKLTTLKTELDDKITTSTKGVAAKLQREGIPKAVNKALEDMLNDIAANDDGGDVESDPQQAKKQAKEPPASKDQPPAVDSTLLAEVEKLKKSLQAVSQQAETDRKQAEADRKRAQDLEAAQRKANMRNSFIQEMKADGLPQIINPEDFFELLNVHGKLVEQGDRFVLATGKTDQLGEPVYQPVSEALPDLVKEQRYSIYVGARGGTGTGATPSNVSSTNTSNKYIKSDEIPNAQDIYQIMQDPARKAEFLAEAASAGGSGG